MRRTVVGNSFALQPSRQALENAVSALVSKAHEFLTYEGESLGLSKRRPAAPIVSQRVLQLSAIWSEDAPQVKDLVCQAATYLPVIIYIQLCANGIDPEAVRATGRVQKHFPYLIRDNLRWRAVDLS